MKDISRKESHWTYFICPAGLYATEVAGAETGRLLRRTIIRYITLSYCIALRYYLLRRAQREVILYYHVQDGELAAAEEVPEPGPPGARRPHAGGREGDVQQDGREDARQQVVVTAYIHSYDASLRDLD